MIDPNNLALLTDLKDSRGDIIKLSDIPLYDKEDYDLSDTKEFSRYLKDIESDVRSSYEYRQFIRYLKEYFGMGYSGTYENMNSADSKIKIEIHHTPFSLYDIVCIVHDKRSFYHQDLSVQMVAKEVMECHYKQLVGLYPLTQTEHQLVHNGYLFIPTYKIFGRYDLFVSAYRDFIDDDMMKTLQSIEDYSKVSYDEERQRILLSQSNVYIDMDRTYSLPMLDNLKLALTNRVQEIKQNSYVLPIFDEDTKSNALENPNTSKGE